MLSRYRVVDLTDERGQFAGFLLGALGADVIAVEPPGGSRSRRLPPLDAAGSSLAHAAANRAKRSVVCDTATPDGRAALDRLVAGADVLVVSGTPAELTAAGVDVAGLAERHPALVVASISPFGLSGPKADWAASDLTLWAAGGPLALTGDPDRPPVQISAPQAYLHAAANAASGVMMALLERDRSGLGQVVDVSAQICAMPFTQAGVLSAAANAGLLRRSGGGIGSGDVFLRFVYPASDGHVSITLVFGAAVGPSTARLMQFLHERGHLDAATAAKDWVGYHIALNEGRESLDGFEALKETLARFTAGHTKAELFALAREHRLLIAPVATTADVLGSEQFADRGFWQDIDGNRFPGHWFRSAVPLGTLTPAPVVGADTVAVLAEPRPEPAVAGGRDTTMSADTPAAARRPLEGLKVVDFMWAVAGPTLTRTLADAGATVVRVESSTRVDPARAFMPFLDDRPGVENSALFHDLAAGKLSFTLDLNSPEGRSVALDLARWADVVCEAYSPRAMRSFGLDYEQLRAVNPSLVMLSSCLFGQTGPLASFAGYGNLAGAMTGFYNVTGWPDRDPVGPFGAYTDYAAPPVALTTLLAAVDHRRRTGEGQYLDFSQAEASLHFLAAGLLEYEVHGRIVGRLGNAHPALCPHGVFPCAGDDQWVAVVARDDGEWQRLARLIGRGDLAGAGLDERLARRDEIESAVAAWTSGRVPSEVDRLCQAEGVASHAVQNAPELMVDPQLDHVGHWHRVPHPVHVAVVVEGARVALSRTPVVPHSAGPLLGEHVEHVLRDLLGYDTEHIEQLSGTGIFR
jgi:crotonobetainyl-CoA:carnitine CoA-transferase CaiB-like acyl-CoA transferase